MEIIKIYTDIDGHSHFKIVNVFETMPVLFNNIEVLLSKPIDVSNILLHEFAGDYVLSWHNPPEEQYVVILSGALKISIKDGTSKHFSVGDVFLAADLTGSGHVTNAVEKGKALVINVRSLYETEK